MSARTISVVSLGIILALLGVIGYMGYLLKISAGPVRTVRPSTTVTNLVTQVTVRKINATNLNLLAALTNRVWSWAGLESTNYPQYIANLRAFGCPNETIKDIILTDIARLYAKRRAELRRQVEPYRFWQPNDPTHGNSAKLQKYMQALDREQRALTRELLGVDYQTEFARYFEGEDTQEYRYDFLPSEKRDQVLALQSKYDEMEQEIYARTQGLMLDEDEEALKAIQRQREADMANVLSPEELEEFELRNSSVAENLRSQLSGFDPSEDEFRRLFRLQKDYEQQINQAFGSDDSQAEARARAQEEAQRAFDEETKKALGEKRFQEYQRAQDADYRALLQLTDRFGMARESADSIYAMKLEAERQKLTLEANNSLTEEQRQAALAAIAQETERQVAATLGDEKLFRTYRRSAGVWMQSLAEPELVLPPPEMELEQ